MRYRMPPKVQTNVLRGRGRPKRSAAPDSVVVANAPTKNRGRVPKEDVVDGPTEPPKKRGRPVKAQVKEPIEVTEPLKRGRRSLFARELSIEEALRPKKRVGRPPKSVVAKGPISMPKKRAGRTSKANAAIEETYATPRRRGRPAKNAAAVDISRVAGSPRVTKKSYSQSGTKATRTTTAPRLNPHMRSKLRTRPPPAQKIQEDAITRPAKRRGRPAKTAAAPAPLSKRGSSRKAGKAAVTKPTAQRKKRGYTVLEVSDKHVAKVQQYLQELRDAESLPTAIDKGPAEADKDGVDEAIEAGAGDENEEGEAVAEEEEHLDMTAAEDVEINSPTAAHQQSTVGLAGQIQEEEVFEDHTVSYVSVDVQEDDAQDEVVQDVSTHEKTEKESTEVPTEAGIKTSLHEVVHIEHL